MKNTWSIHCIEYRSIEYKVKLLKDGNSYIQIADTSWQYITTFVHPNTSATSATRAKLALKEYLKQQR